MRNLLIFMGAVAIFVLGFRFLSCTGFNPGVSGSGATRTETRAVNGFKGIDTEVSSEIEVSVSDQFYVEVQAQESILPILKTELNGDRLHIYFEENVRNHDKIKIIVKGPAFDRLSIAGSGTIRFQTPLNSDRMDIDIAGSGDVILPDANIGQIECGIAGSGNIRLGGKCNEMKVDVAGSGDVDAVGLLIGKLDVDIAGSGSVKADVVQTLDASISGSGDVFYKGSPSINADISGSGKVKRLD